MNLHQFSATLKDNAKECLSGHFGLLIGSRLTISCITVFAALLLSPIIAIPVVLETNTFLSLILTHITALLTGTFIGVFEVGIALIYLKIACKNPYVSFSDIFYGFRNQFKTALGISFVIALLAVIPSCIAEIILYALEASDSAVYLLFSLFGDLGVRIITTLLSLFLFPCYYLMLDFPGKTAGEILKTSFNLMKGQKGKLLYILVSFVPLQLLCTVSVIGGFWVEPYLLMTQALFFFHIMKKENVK